MILSTIVIATSLTAMGIDVWVNIAVIPGRHWLLQLENITSNLDIAVAFFMTLIISSQWYVYIFCCLGVFLPLRLISVVQVTETP